MTYLLAPFKNIPLDEALLEHLIAEHESIALPRLNRLWRYYRNPLAEPTMSGGSAAPPAQSAGLPARLIEIKQLRRDDRCTREIVIENDIAWRIHTLVDFMFPAAPKIVSQAEDQAQRRAIEAILEAVLDANGGIALWHNAALLGSVYGHVDLLIECDLRAGSSSSPESALVGTEDGPARFVRIEIIEAPRAIALVNRHDYRVLDAYVLHWRQPSHEIDSKRETWLSRLSRTLRRTTPTDCNGWASRNANSSARAEITVTEIHSAARCQRYEDGVLVSETINRLGRLPVVHVQNLSQPLYWEGLSDVEPLIPLQDELNTRLCDRANRVTMQSFRMWLAKGIDNFNDHPVGPGQMWMTDNLEASIEPFGGDADSPSERQHIEELREALDKASGVTPAAAGHIKARVGNLTSENALRISVMGTIAKIKRKRITYGAGIAQLCELILHALDAHGVYRTQPAERKVEIAWADPLASDESRRIQDALDKAKLGIPTSVLRAELGYPDQVNAEPSPSGMSL